MYKLFLYFTPHVLEFAAPGTGKSNKEKMIMKEFQYTVKDACGIHARPAGLLVKTVKGFASTATLEKDGKSCDMRKLMALMGMGVKQGETITIKVEGDDEEAAAAAIQKFLTETSDPAVMPQPSRSDLRGLF